MSGCVIIAQIYWTYKSPEISINNFVIDYVYKKSVETCLAH